MIYIANLRSSGLRGSQEYRLRCWQLLRLSNHAAVFASNTTDITPGRTIRSPGQGLRAPSPTAKFNLKIEEPNNLNGYIQHPVVPWRLGSFFRLVSSTKTTSGSHRSPLLKSLNVDASRDALDSSPTSVPTAHLFSAPTIKCQLGAFRLDFIENGHLHCI
jgi:hypothetical protein